ncbi:MAG: meng menh ubie: ubiquinone/menaquinone biosynthesis methyltransferase [Chthoniobacter sp.]|jgi:demethylmenaquinone methyltransferase/2-methoxy-6-polyprenyl-1,4-benzoquinol methylase|nr:meng menh ubie: ubiquinone/menaquinone biosynthesis methyltransferase [Chthoniobacter sp.]
MVPPSKSQNVQKLFGRIARRYDLANHLLSGGFDFFWRRRAVQVVRSWHPSRILDLATGSGDLALSLRAACPRSLVVGADFCEPMLMEARRKGFSNLVTADALRMPFADGSFDVVVVGFGLRNMDPHTGALREMARVLRPGGHLLVLDFSLPPAPWRTPYRLYLHRVLPRIAGWVSGEKAAYDYLAESIEEFPSGAAMCQLIETSGFGDARCQPLTGGIVSLYTASRREPSPA